MSSKTFAAVIALGLIVPQMPVRAAADETCEATQSRREARRDRCIARCQRRAESQITYEDIIATIPERLAQISGRMSLCQEACDKMHLAALLRVERSSSCGSASAISASAISATAKLCQARALRAEARQLSCQVRCGVWGDQYDSVDQHTCEVSCVERYQTHVAALANDPLCVDAAARL